MQQQQKMQQQKQKQKQKIQQQQQKQKMYQRIKSHVGEFVTSVILMKYIVLLYKNDVISHSSVYLKNLSNLLDEQTKPGNIDTTNPLASIHLSHNLINFLIRNLNTHNFIENLRLLCAGGSSNPTTMAKFMEENNSVKLLTPYVNSVLKTVNLPDKNIIDDIYENCVTRDGDFNKFLDETVSFADKIAKEIVSKRNKDLRTLPKPPPQILPQHHKQPPPQILPQHKQQTHGQPKPPPQILPQHKKQTHGQQKQQTHGQHKPTHRNMNNKHRIHEKILATIKHMLERLKNMNKHHLQPQTTVSIPTTSDKAKKLLGFPTDNKKTDGNEQKQA